MRGLAVTAKDCQGVIERGHIEDAIQVSARQHLVNKRARIRQLQMNLIASGPAM